MREYRAWFSFYSEEYGNFDDAAYTVQAESPFDARKEAWMKWNQFIESKFQRCVKLYAVTWQPNPLDMGDYFYSHAADIKQAVGHIENVDIPNNRLQKGDQSPYYEMQKHYYLGALQTVDAIAKDLYADKGIVPPSIYEELYYAQELCYQLEYGDQYTAFQNKIDRAKQWDKYSYPFDIRDLFKHGYIDLGGEAVLFRDQFGRNGIYPVYNDLNDGEYQYISRWQSSMKVNRLAKLQPLKAADVITDSAGYMTYDCQFLLLNPGHFHPDFHTPENSIWTTGEDVMNITQDFPDEFCAENVITGQRMMFGRNDFLGVLRPDVAARYVFEDLKAEYAAAHENQNEAESEDFEEGEYGD